MLLKALPLSFAGERFRCGLSTDLMFGDRYRNILDPTRTMWPGGVNVCTGIVLPQCIG